MKDIAVGCLSWFAMLRIWFNWFTLQIQSYTYLVQVLYWISKRTKTSRRTPRGYRDRSHHSREESRQRYRRHRIHGEEPRPHSRMEGHVREDEDRDTGQQRHAHDRDSYMELDHRSGVCFMDILPDW